MPRSTKTLLAVVSAIALAIVSISALPTSTTHHAHHLRSRPSMVSPTLGTIPVPTKPVVATATTTPVAMKTPGAMHYVVVRRILTSYTPAQRFSLGLYSSLDVRQAFHDWITGIEEQARERTVSRLPPEPAPVVSTSVPPPPAPVVATGGPTPISDWRCANPNGHAPRPDIGVLIQQTFGPAAPWAESIAVRESGCQPGAVNSVGCVGLFQFCHHDDIFIAICGSADLWSDPACSVKAAYSLYSGRGIDPWKL